MIQIYRERYLYVWQTSKHELYLSVSLERGPILVIKIYVWPKTLPWMDTPCFPPTLQFFEMDSHHPPFSRIIAWHHRDSAVCSQRSSEREPLSTRPPCPVFRACAFGGVFDLSHISEACLPEEHGANVVGNLFDSRWGERRLWLLGTSPYLQEIADPRNFLWKVVGEIFTGPRNECETFFPF